MRAIERDGLPWQVRVLSNVDLLGRLGCLMPSLANAALDSRFVRGLMRKTLGLSAKRPLPHYAPERFDRWFRGHVAALCERRKNATVTDRRYRIVAASFSGTTHSSVTTSRTSVLRR